MSSGDINTKHAQFRVGVVYTPWFDVGLSFTASTKADVVDRACEWLRREMEARIPGGCACSIVVGVKEGEDDGDVSS